MWLYDLLCVHFDLSCCQLVSQAVRIHLKFLGIQPWYRDTTSVRHTTFHLLEWLVTRYDLFKFLEVTGIPYLKGTCLCLKC